MTSCRYAECLYAQCRGAMTFQRRDNFFACLATDLHSVVLLSLGVRAGGLEVEVGHELPVVNVNIPLFLRHECCRMVS